MDHQICMGLVCIQGRRVALMTVAALQGMGLVQFQAGMTVGATAGYWRWGLGRGQGLLLRLGLLFFFFDLFPAPHPYTRPESGCTEAQECN
jgi:hypothetical protein